MTIKKPRRRPEAGFRPPTLPRRESYEDRATRRYGAATTEQVQHDHPQWTARQVAAYVTAVTRR